MNPRPSTCIRYFREANMELTFYISGAVAVIATILMLTRLNLVHALLYMIVSLLAVAVDFFVLGAAFAAALEAIVYAGAIMVLFLFVVMMLNIGRQAAQTERQWLAPGIWAGPVILSSILIVEVVYLTRGSSAGLGTGATGPKEVGIALFGPYIVGVELASMLLLAGLVGAYHLGLRKTEKPEIQHDTDTHEGRADTGGDLVLAGADRSARTT
ncbi:MAG TPA: NADH-quinone oxidoreductase subunit J [Bryobacteraceae bacterium]|nr:NADH-quinone oxidoreductase subunit J [Bryobacteraceae bacterium]